MKGFIKAIIAGAVILGIGIAVLLIALGLNGWSFAPDFTTQEFTSTEDNSSLSVNLSAGKLTIEYHDGDKIYISYPVSSGYQTNITELDGKLSVECNIHRWYNFTWGVHIPDTVIKLPRNAVTEVSVTVNAGTLDMHDLNLERVKTKVNAGTCNIGNITGLELLDIDLNAGAVNVNSVSGDKITCSVNAGAANIKDIGCNSTDIKLSAGSANLSFAGAKSDYTATVNVSAGSCNGLSTQTGGEKEISVRVSAGSCNISFAS